jgi:hypothetical protein
MSKTLGDVRREMEDIYGTKDNKYSDFPVGTKVKIICPYQDSYFFYGETGTVTKNEGRYLGINIEFDEPRHFEGGYIQTGFNFNPKDLQSLDLVIDIEKDKLETEDMADIKMRALKHKDQEKRSKRFKIMDI